MGMRHDQLEQDMVSQLMPVPKHGNENAEPIQLGQVICSNGQQEANLHLTPSIVLITLNSSNLVR